MKCSFIDKYIDKIYCSTLNILEERALNNHLKTCDSCKLVYEGIIDESKTIKQAVTSEDVPFPLAVNIIYSIDRTKYKKNRFFMVKRLVIAVSVILMVAASSIYYSSMHKSNFSGFTPYPDTPKQQDIKVSVPMEKILKDYIIKNLGNTSKEGGKTFAAIHIFGTEESDNFINVYLWALAEEYIWAQGLIQSSGISIPMSVQLKKDADSYIALSYRVPRDGSLYTRDIEDIFRPVSIREKVIKRGGNVEDLANQNKLQAMEFFKEHHTPPTSRNIQNTIRDLLSKYGWNAEGEGYTVKVKMPSTFIDKPGEFPVGLYWAYNRVLSNDIGHDFSLYKGQEVTAHIIPLKEEFADGPNKKVRAVMLERDGKFIGGWLDHGRHYSFMASLGKDYFVDIAKKSWGEWLVEEGLVDYSKDGYEGKLSSLSPEDIIRKYYEAIDKKDYRTAYSLLSKAYQSTYLSSNVDEDKLYNEGWGQGLQNIKSVKVLKVTDISQQLNPKIVPDKKRNRKVSEIKQFGVNTEMVFLEEIVRQSGENPWFITLVKETPDAPWAIDSIGTGP